MQARSNSLEQLALVLNRVFRAKLATQNGISAALRISQSTVSKAKRRVLKRETADTRALYEYANSLLMQRNVPQSVLEAAEGFFSAGGSEAELVETIATATRLVRGRRTV